MITEERSNNRKKFAAVLSRHYEDLFASAPEYAYSAVRITDALARYAANKEGQGIKRTGKELGINHTYKAIREFLEGA